MATRHSMTAVLLAAIVASGAVHVAEAVVFYYDSYGGFIAGTDSPGGSGTFANDPDTATGGGAFDVGADADARTAAGRHTTVSWGIASGAVGPYNGKSGFALSKVNNGTITVGSGEVGFGKLTHFNRPIDAGSDLDFVQMDWSLQLFDSLADATADTGAFRTIDLTFTLYNWETPNDPANNPAYSVSYDNGATWTTIGPGVCPGSTPEGTLIVGHLGKTYQSAFTDHPGYPAWNGECSDAHIFESGLSNEYEFSRAGRNYRVELIGFYGPTGALTETFWACEVNQCFGNVNLRVRDVTPPALIPTLSQWALMLTSLLLAGLGLAALRRVRTGSGT